MLSERFTRLKFDDFTSDPITITNGTTQGCPLSMLFYAFYNADLIDLAQGQNELSTGFVDDCALVAISSSLDKNRIILKDMMERLGGGFSWSMSHNSPFGLTKLALLDFPRTPSDTPTNPLLLDRTNSDGTTTTQQVQTVSSYKYLGVHFDSHLRWNVHTTKVIASATRLSQVLWKVCKVKDGLSSNRMRQIWNTTAVVRFLYAADIWFTAPYTPPNAKKKRGST